MVEDKVARVVEKLLKMAYRSTFSGDARIPRFAIRYRQGNRTFYTTALAAPEIVNITHIDSMNDSKGDPEPEKRWNRPFNAEHAAAIAKYLTDTTTKDNYILPPITLDAEIPLEFVDCGEGEENQMTVGFLMIPINYHFHVTDGQHRLRAIHNALQENPDLERDAIAVNIVQESSLEKVHQDFADCAKVRPIPTSLITTFETRDRIRLFTKDVCDLVPLFEKRAERISNSVGKTSSKLYTINHVKVACEELLIADSTAQDRTKSIRCARELEDTKYNNWLERIVKFFNLFAQTNPQWKYVLGLDLNNGQATAALKKLKEDYLLFNGTALAVIGRVGHEILKVPQLFELKTKQLANLNWQRMVDGKDDYGNKTSIINPLWSDNILVGGKVTGSKHPLLVAGAKVKHLLNLNLTDNEKAVLTSMQLEAEPQEVA